MQGMQKDMLYVSVDCAHTSVDQVSNSFNILSKRSSIYEI